jgi:hypothetical protein
VAHCLKIGYAHCNASTPETFASGQQIRSKHNAVLDLRQLKERLKVR